MCDYLVSIVINLYFLLTSPYRQKHKKYKKVPRTSYILIPGSWRSFSQICCLLKTPHILHSQ